MELRLGEEKRRKKNKRQDENKMFCPIPQGDHNNAITFFPPLFLIVKPSELITGSKQMRGR